MDDTATQRLFQWLDRAFWVIWAGYPILIWMIVTRIKGAIAQLSELAPDQAACIAQLPQVMNFSTAGQVVFWVVFAIEMALYAVILFLAHRVIHDCAKGRVFMAGMIGALRLIGLTIAVFPVLDLILGNLSFAAFVATGDLPVFQPDFALDLPVIGVGLLMVTMATAMRLAARLQQDAALTI